MCRGIIICHDPGDRQEAEEEGESVVTPAGAVDDFHEHCVATVLYGLSDG